MNSITLFKILNLGVFIGVIIYGMRRYGILAIFKMIREEKQQDQEMVQKYQQALLDCDHVQQDSKKQEILYRDLGKKFEKWSEVTQKKQVQEHKDLEHRLDDLEQKKIRQAESLLYKKLIQKELPSLLEEVESDIKKDVAHNTDHVKKYINHIMNFIEK